MGDLVQQEHPKIRVEYRWGHEPEGAARQGRQTTVGMSNTAIFVVCFWLYVRKF